jgi:hypothetical protein
LILQLVLHAMDFVELGKCLERDICRKSSFKHPAVSSSLHDKSGIFRRLYWS